MPGHPRQSGAARTEVPHPGVGKLPCCCGRCVRAHGRGSRWVWASRERKRAPRLCSDHGRSPARGQSSVPGANSCLKPPDLPRTREKLLGEAQTFGLLRENTDGTQLKACAGSGRGQGAAWHLSIAPWVSPPALLRSRGGQEGSELRALLHDQQSGLQGSHGLAPGHLQPCCSACHLLPSVRAAVPAHGSSC